MATPVTGAARLPCWAPPTTPAALAHAETRAHSLGLGECGFEVPLINSAAVQYRLGRGYQMHECFAFLMCDKPFGKFENYIFFSPPFFF